MKFSMLALLPMLFSYSITYAASSLPSDIYSEDILIEEVNHEEWNFYKIVVENPAKLTVKLRKISDDVDLYVSQTKKPTEDEFTCAPLKMGKSIETCRLTSHMPTTWYIGVHGKQESDYQLSVKTDDLRLISQIN